MSTYNRQSFLATLGNRAVKAGGSPVLITDSEVPYYDVLAGDIVIWDKKENISLSVADIATAKNVAIGVGQGKPGMLATDILHIGGDNFDFCKGSMCVNVTKPSCALPQVVDVFFDGAYKGDTFTIAVHLDDGRVRSLYQFNEKAEYVYTVPTKVCDEDCTEQAICDELSCKFVDLINGKVQKDPRMITYFRTANLADQYQPFHAVRSFNKAGSRKIFCISAEEGACEHCANLPAITGIKIGGVTTAFTYTTMPGDATKTLHDHMSRVLEQANLALSATGGSAILTAGTKKCCPYNIMVNTCEDEVVFIVGGVDLEPCETYNPYVAQVIDKACVSCDTEPSSLTLNCGFTLVTDVLKVEGNPLTAPNITTPNYYGRTIDIEFAGDGWKCSNNYVTEFQKQVLPRGLGYFWQDKAHYGQHNGGTARNWRYSNKRVGNIGLPDNASRAVAAHNLIKWEETYCVYNVKSTQTNKTFFNNFVNHSNTDVSYVLIPENDNVTKASFEGYLSALQNRGICCEGEISCGINPDEFGELVFRMGESTSVNVGTNDVFSCPGRATTYETKDLVNVTLSGTAPAYAVTPTAAGPWSFTYVVYCDGVLLGEAVVEGIALQA